MAAYDDKLASFSRTPVTLVVITLDYCSRVCADGRTCFATGTKCYNTYPTCKYKVAYNRITKDYKFTSADAPLPFAGPRPYIKGIKYLPTEIKTALTVNARTTFEFYDEPDGDVGIDPYLGDRSSIQGTFWKKLIARNANYKGRMIKVYEGFIGLTEAEFVQKWAGALDNITLDQGVVKVEAVDLLKAIDKIDVPGKVDIKLIINLNATYLPLGPITFTGSGKNDMERKGDYTWADVLQIRVQIDGTGSTDTFKWSKDAGATWEETGKSITGGYQTLSGNIKVKFEDKTGHWLDDRWDFLTGAIGLTNTTGLDAAPAYVRIGDEIFSYTGISESTKELVGCMRECFDTTAEEHKEQNKVEKVRYYAPGNGFDILKTMLLTDAAIAAGYVDSTAFDYWRDTPGGEVNLSGLIVEPTKLGDLYFELVELLDCKSWVAEDLKITISRNLPNLPGRVYWPISDALNIVEKSPKVDLNNESRKSRVYLYWDKKSIGDAGDVDGYDCLDVAMDAEAESAAEYGEIAEKKIFCRWIRSGYAPEDDLAQFIKDFTARYIWNYRDAMPLVDLKVELKDTGIKTGDFARLSTDELSQVDGTSLYSIFQAVKRESQGSGATLRFLKTNPRRIGFIAPEATPAYTLATDAEKEYGFITEETGLIGIEQGYFTW